MSAGLPRGPLPTWALVLGWAAVAFAAFTVVGVLYVFIDEWRDRRRYERELREWKRRRP